MLTDISFVTNFASEKQCKHISEKKHWKQLNMSPLQTKFFHIFRTVKVYKTKANLYKLLHCSAHLYISFYLKAITYIV